MTDQKMTRGYGERIRAELEARGEGPRWLHRQLQEKVALGWENQEWVKERYPDLRGASYAGIREYVQENVRNPRIETLKAISDGLGKGIRWRWIAYGEPPKTEEEARLQGVEVDHPRGTRRTREDKLVRAAMEGLNKTLPLYGHLTFEYRTLSVAAIKLGMRLAEGAPDPEDSYRRAGRLLGRAVAAPLKILSAEIPITDERFAQAYVSAMSHAVEIIAPYAQQQFGPPEEGHSEPYSPEVPETATEEEN